MLLQEMADRRLLELTRETAHLAQARLQSRGHAPRINFARMISDLAGARFYGEDAEAIQEFARQASIAHPDPCKPFIPFAAFRDLTSAAAGAGGYLVETTTSEAVDILRPWSVTARAGVTIETGLVGNQVVPKVTAKSSPAWLNTEAAQITPSQPTTGQIAMVPKQVGCVINFSRQLSMQANAESFAGRELMRAVGTAFDQAIIGGSGASGQPTGLLQTAGVQTQSGTTLNAGVFAMKRLVAEANADDSRITFLSTPAVRELLENRERHAGSGAYVWQGDRVAARPAYASTDVPSATMISGDFANIFLGIWGAGFILEINPYDPTHFKTGVIQARVIVSADVAIPHPSAFVVASPIT